MDYLDRVDQQVGLSERELSEFGKPSGSKKALVAAMAMPLKPGKAIQNSSQDNC